MSQIEAITLDIGGIGTGLTVGGPADGRPVVFLHGGTPGVTPYAGGSHVWGTTLDTFARHYRVVAIDLLGSGRTGYPDTPAFIDAIGKHASDVLDHLGASGCHVVGHDLGGAVALWLAMNAPARTASVSVVASADATPLGDSLDDFAFLNPPGTPFGREAQYWAYDRVSYTPHHIDELLIEPSLEAAQGAGATQARAAMADPAGRAAFVAAVNRMKQQLWTLAKATGLSQPAQFIWGANDPLTPRERGFALFETVGRTQPHCQFHLVARTGSFVYREQPAHFHDLVTGFIEGLAETPPEFRYPREAAAA